MRISETGKAAASGFTLIELLTVLLILGIAVSLVSVNLPRDAQSVLEDDARRLAALLQHAREESIVGGRAVAWVAGKDGYAFLQRARGEWVPLGADAAFRPRTWPPAVALVEVRIAGMAVPASEPLVFAPAGDNPPFALVLASAGNRVSVYGDASGRVAVKR